MRNKNGKMEILFPKSLVNKTTRFALSYQANDKDFEKTHIFILVQIDINLKPKNEIIKSGTKISRYIKVFDKPLIL